MSTKQRLAWWRLLLSGVALSLSACAPETSSGSIAVPRTPEAAVAEAASFHGDPEAGLLLFNDHCLVCHSATLSRTFVGPTLYQVGDRLTIDYIRASIEKPHDRVAAEFTSATPMPDNLVEQLSDSELADIVAYLMTTR